MENQDALDKLHQDYKIHELAYLWADLAVAYLDLARMHARYGSPESFLESMAKAKSTLGNRPLVRREHIDAWNAAVNVHDHYVRTYNKELGLELEAIVREKQL